ncbi:MAG: M24 family metallopeptidase [Pirellulales bacterium]
MAADNSRFATRRNKLRRLMKKDGVQALLVSNHLNVTYLTGFTGEDSYLLVTKDNEIVLSDSRFTTQLEYDCPELDVVIRNSGDTLIKAMQKMVASTKSTELAVEADSMTWSLSRAIDDGLKKVTVTPSSGLVGQLREIKDKEEIKDLKFAVYLAEKAFSVIRASMHGAQTEKEIAANIEHEIRRFGGTGCSFDPIVAVGYRAALPHATPTDQKIEADDFVLIDWGAEGRGYMSDLTRVLVTGKPSAKLRKVYNTVLKAQMASIETIKEGATMAQVDFAARNIIAKAGYDKYFGHSIGHGLGSEVHENPFMSRTSDRPLKAGMVVTVEPGIYLPGWGGVRIEDDILVTKKGFEVLTNVPKEFDETILS